MLLAMVLSIAVTTTTPSRAGPETEIIEGHVLTVQDADVIVDLAAKQGMKANQVIELWRPLSLRHPVTKKQVSDRFRIGSLKLIQVREVMSLARVEGDVDREPLPGDIVMLRREVEVKPVAPPPSTTTTTPYDGGAQVEPAGTSKPPPPVGASPPDRAAERVAKLFQSLSGSSVPARIRAYEDYVRQRPNSRYSPVLYEEAQYLRRLMGMQAEVVAKTKISAVSFDPPQEVVANQPVTIALEVGGDATGAILQHRLSGSEGYQSLVMSSVGVGYYSATLPAEAVKAPELEYFIEASAPDGSTVAIIGAVSHPEQLSVRDAPKPYAPLSPEATISAWSDYADYNRWRGNDWVWQTEGYMGLRYGDTGVRALRTGFGVYRGKGGSLEELDELELSPRKIGLTYGYLEAEFGFTDFVGLVARGVIGLEDDGISGGSLLMLRIGNDKRTNLLIGGEFLLGVGLRGIAQLELAVFESVPILLRTEVTNQPAGTSSSIADVRPGDDVPPEQAAIDTNDVGARGIVQVGYRFFDDFVVSVRGSYQGRTINHSGPGFGGGVTYSW